MRKKHELEELSKKILDDNEQEKWEKGELGRDPKHMKFVSEEETKRFIESKSSYATSIRLPKDLVSDLRFLATKNGLNYQTYLKMILTQHVSTEKKKNSA